ncbi:helix-turn-helix domain-containing protein [Serratia fonticola]|uniref:helix-turn-helix domain-containing protein n=1 Tax=Serratia fonticola TaxID=47917 RepID=UPI0013785C53|nr:helix-turn-helix transcriptional regulator [Serratia fonticola]NCG51967.1 hypothetical protein [Serratia fonticola]
MNDTPTEKQVIILHPCGYTRLGIRALLPPTCRVLDTDDLALCRYWLLTCGQIDRVIIAQQGTRYSMVSALGLIDWLCHDDSGCRVQVMLNTDRAPWLRHYLAEYGFPVTVIEPGSPLQVFIRQLEQRVHDEELPIQKEATCFGKGYPEHLSAKELQILEALLTGKKGCQVARQLSLSEKAVSYYKGRALTKLGMKSIHSLLTNSYLHSRFH